MDTSDLLSYSTVVFFMSYATEEVSSLLHRVFNGVLGRKDRTIWDEMLIILRCYLFSSIGLVIITASCGSHPLPRLQVHIFSIREGEAILYLAAWGKLGVRNVLTHPTQHHHGNINPKIMSLPLVI